MKKTRNFILVLSFFALCFAAVSCSGSKKNQMKGLSDGWWKDTSIYHIWIKGFCDSDGDGCGDINGIRSKLDYLHDYVGCDTLWISPFFECAGKGTAVDYNMHGYDTTDYYAVNSLFGTEEDVLALVAECHQRGMKIIFDFVPNHTSSEHPWFKDSVAGTNDKRDWYVWSDSGKGANPLGSANPAWFFSEEAGAWYYAPFWEKMPDLNYENPAVQKEMRNVVFYWLDRGFDGMRVDAARYLIEDGSRASDSDSTHKWFTDLSARIAKRYKSPKVMLGEIWLEKRRDGLERYFGTDGKREFDLVTDFDVGRTQLASVVIGASALPDAAFENPHDSNAAYAAFLCNHDEYQNRLGTVFGTNYKKSAQALCLSVFRPQVPIIYYGQEIALADLPLYGDIRHRGPFDWESAKSMVLEQDSPVTVLRKALEVRKTYARTFSDASLEDLFPNRGVCAAYVLHPQEKTEKDILCVFNFSQTDFEEYVFTKKTEPKSTWKDSQRIFCTPGSEKSSLHFDGDRVVINSIPANGVALFLLD